MPADADTIPPPNAEDPTMRVPTLPFLLLLLAPLGCASSPSTTAEPPAIPVFRNPDQVPCEYEQIEVLRHQMTVIVSGGAEYDRIEERELARLGDEAGGDAVLIPEREVDRPLRIVVEEPMTAYFQGVALRYTDPGCGVRSGGVR